MNPDASPLDAPRWRVRPMHRGDLDGVMRVESEIYPFPWTPGNFADSLESGYDAWVFESAQGLIGYAVLMWVPDEVHLLNLSVAAGLQGRGYGRAMLEWLCEDARLRGAHSMLLEVRPSNRVARALYESMEFAPLGVRKRYYPGQGGSREDAIVLRRELRNE